MKGYMGYPPRSDQMNLIGSYVLRGAGSHGNSSPQYPDYVHGGVSLLLARWNITDIWMDNG
eukprot:376093-Pleurochrysis_carterae.AAC.1